MDVIFEDGIKEEIKQEVKEETLENNGIVDAPLGIIFEDDIKDEIKKEENDDNGGNAQLIFLQRKWCSFHVLGAISKIVV